MPSPPPNPSRVISTKDISTGGAWEELARFPALRELSSRIMYNVPRSHDGLEEGEAAAAFIAAHCPLTVLNLRFAIAWTGEWVNG